MLLMKQLLRKNNLDKTKNKFGITENLVIFTVQYRGLEQLVAREAHNLEVKGSSPLSATRNVC